MGWQAQASHCHRFELHSCIVVEEQPLQQTTESVCCILTQETIPLAWPVAPAPG